MKKILQILDNFAAAFFSFAITLLIFVPIVFFFTMAFGAISGLVILFSLPILIIFGFKFTFKK